MNAANIINTFEIIASDVLNILTAPLDILSLKLFIIDLNVDDKSVSSIDKLNSPDSNLAIKAIILLNKLDNWPTNTVVTKYITSDTTEIITSTISVTPNHLGILLSTIFCKNGWSAYAIANAIKNGIVIFITFAKTLPQNGDVLYTKNAIRAIIAKFTNL